MDIETKGYWKKNIIFILLFLAVILAGAIFIVPFLWPVGFIIWLFIVILGLFLIIRWHAKNTAYVCSKCSHTFIISPATDFLSPHMFDEKLLQCPECGESSWCKAMSVGSINGVTTSFEARTEINAKSKKSLYFQIGIVLFLYLLLWANSFYLYLKLPETIPVDFSLSGKPDSGGNKSSLFLLPLTATIFLALHGIICFYGAYSREIIDYAIPLLTIIFSIMLLFFIGIQYLSALHGNC